MERRCKTQIKSGFELGFTSGLFILLQTFVFQINATSTTCGKMCWFDIHVDLDAVFSDFCKLMYFILVDNIPKLSAIYCTA